MPFLGALTGILVLSAVVMAALQLAFYLPVTQGHRIREEKVRKIKNGKLARIALANSLLSAGLVYTYTIVFEDQLLRTGDASWLTIAYESVRALVVYDFAYYAMHRYLFHAWGPLRAVHTYHHVAKYPTALDSLYVHPVEMALGVTLLHASVFVIGPVHSTSFLIVFTVFSLLNILIHAGIDFPGRILAPISGLAKKHDRHHVHMRAGNFASITPLPDIMFGTAE